MSFRDDRFARTQAFRDDHVLIRALRARDRALLDRRILLHDEHVLTILAGLDRLRRDHDRMRQRGEVQVHAGELPWPQAAIGIRQRGFQLDRR